MTDLPWRLSIDFGTSNTAASVAEGRGGVFVLRLGSRSDAITSSVAVYNGEILAGEAATQVAGIYPGSFEPTPKRRLGEEAVILGGKVFDPVDLVAAVLRYVLNQAVRFVGSQLPSQVVLTHPEAWDEYMKGRLIEAATRAGISAPVLVLMPEPVAAAWHYAATSDVHTGAHIAVLDFGGGTCDAAVLKLSKTPAGPAFHVVSSGGLDPLGGHDFDAQLENWVYSQLSAEGKTGLLQSLASQGAAADRAVLRDQVREAKHALSFHGSAPIGVRSGGEEYVCTVTRHEFEQLIDPQISRAVELVRRVVHEALPSTDQLHRVYLTGGSSHIPLLQAKLRDLLPLKLGLMGDPKQVTGLGALQAFSPVNVGTGSERAPAGAEDGIHARDGNRTEVTAVLSAPLIAAKPAGRLGFTVDRSVDRKRPKVFKWMLALGAAVAAGLILVATIALPKAQWLQVLAGPSATSPPAGSSATPTPAGPSATPTPSGSSATPAPAGSSATPTPSGSSATSPAVCGAISRPDLSPGECNLLNRVTSASLQSRLSPESCIRNPEPFRASSALTCRPAPGSGFTATEQPKIHIYGYDSLAVLNVEFDDLIQHYKAGYGSVTEPPGWDTWTLVGETSLQGRILGAVVDQETNVLVWTDEKAVAEIWAQSSAPVQDLYDWWAR